MNKLSFTGTLYGQNLHLVRIDKRKARNLFDKGVEIYLVPSNFKPFNAWFGPMVASLNNCFNFDQLANNYTYYNCINSETGYFPAFYINTKKI
jgi:hypothetical protein